MKRTMIFLMTIYILTVLSTLLSTTWVVKQDGTGDFTTISAAITAAQNDHTILVYPGTYYENISFQGKDITITSLYDGDLYDESYIVNTVIDGSQQGSVVTFNNDETRDAVLNGFTITNGLGSFHPGTTKRRRGGGILIQNASPVISNCRIKHNRANRGGGISLVTSGSPLLKGNVISQNHAALYSGVGAGMNTEIEFCSKSLNSIFLNYGGAGADLFLGNTNQSSITLDTLTVLQPDRYFVVYRHTVPHDFELIVNHGKIEPVAADLYVSPGGCDTNSGLTPADPLQTIAMAMIKILPDRLQQRTVHLAEGIYSRSANNQLFPVAPRPYIDITGTNRETTILDLEEETMAIISYYRIGHHFPGTDQSPYLGYYSVKNITIINGANPMSLSVRGAMYLYYNKAFTLENIDIHNCHTGNNEYIEEGMEVIMIFHSTDMTIKNLHISDSSGRHALSIGSYFGVSFNLYAENIRIRNHMPGPLNQWYSGGDGGGMVLSTGGSDAQPLYATLVNVEITDSVIDHIDPFWGQPPFSQLGMGGPSGEVRIINSTIGNNFIGSVNGSGLKLAGAIDYKLINSIIYGNVPYNISLVNSSPEPANIHISHSLIQGGQNGMLYYHNPNVIVNWGEGNIDANPLWLGEVEPDYTGEYPFMPSVFSPARNAGTLEIPDFEFPEFDLAGNQRVYGSSIDMGAYEWNPEVGVDDQTMLPEISEHDYNLHNYPNPVTELRGMGRGNGVGTTISFIMPQEGEAVIDIYNLKGQFVKRVFNAQVPAGEYEVLWNGRDEQERPVATGFYMYRLQINGDTVATGRCTFIK